MRILFIALAFLVSYSAIAQKDVKEIRKQDSILATLKPSSSEKDRFKAYMDLATLWLTVDSTLEQQYIDKASFVLEQSLDKEWVFKSYLKITSLYLNLGSLRERMRKGLLVASKNQEAAASYGDYESAALSAIHKAIFYRSSVDLESALKANIEAANYAAMTDNDSIKIVAEHSLANTYKAKEDKLMAFKKYVNALQMAEDSKETYPQLRITQSLGDFYLNIDQIDKSKDYYLKAIELAKSLKNNEELLGIYGSMIELYSNNKQFNHAREYLKLYKEINQLVSPDEDANSKLVEANLLFNEDTKKAAKFFRDNFDLIGKFATWGYSDQSAKAMGYIHSFEGNKDSASYYFKKAIKLSYNNNLYAEYDIRRAYAQHLLTFKDYNQSIKVCKENLVMANKLNSLNLKELSLATLDSLYKLTNNIKDGMQNKIALYEVRDGLRKQKEAKDLISIEIEAENRRAEKLKKVKIEETRKRHNIQYLGITGAIVTLFIILAALGKLSINPKVIRALGFISFILLFEFIILLIDGPIHHWTHGEPLQILLIKIVIIGILMPLHHFLEHKVIQYLMHHRHDVA